MPNREQSVFIKNWNEIANILTENRVVDKLPILSEKGVCEGLVDHLIQCLSVGEEDNFFRIYNFICDSNPKLVAQWIMDNFKIEISKDRHFIDKLMNFVFNVHFLYNNQNCSLELPTSALVTEFSETKKMGNSSIEELSSFCMNYLVAQQNANFRRIKGQEMQDSGYFLLEDSASQISSGTRRKKLFSRHLQDKINSLLTSMENESCCNIGYIKGSIGHAICIYRNAENSWNIFDPIHGVWEPLDSTKRASNYLIERLNVLFAIRLSPHQRNEQLEKIFNNAFLTYKSISLKDRQATTNLTGSIQAKISVENNSSVTKKIAVAINSLYERYRFFEFTPSQPQAIKTKQLPNLAALELDGSPHLLRG